MTINSKIAARLFSLRALAVGFTLALAASLTPSYATGDTTAANKATIARSFEAWAAGTGGPYDLLAEAVQWTITGRSAAARTYPSREAFLGEVIRPFNARMSQPLKPVVRDIRAEGDAVIILFDASGVARDGIPYTNTYSWHLRMSGDRIIAATAFFDSIAFDEMWRRVSVPTPAAIR